jgi:hypothetical protein
VLYRARYQLDRRMDSPQSWFGHCREDNNLLPLLEIEPQFSSLWPSHYSIRPLPADGLTAKLRDIALTGGGGGESLPTYMLSG